MGDPRAALEKQQAALRASGKQAVALSPYDARYVRGYRNKDGDVSLRPIRVPDSMEDGKYAVDAL